MSPSAAWAAGDAFLFGFHDSLIAQLRDELGNAEECFRRYNALETANRRKLCVVCAVRPHTFTLHGPGFLVKSTIGKLARTASVARLRQAARAGR